MLSFKTSHPARIHRRKNRPAGAAAPSRRRHTAHRSRRGFRGAGARIFSRFFLYPTPFLHLPAHPAADLTVSSAGRAVSSAAWPPLQVIVSWSLQRGSGSISQAPVDIFTQFTQPEPVDFTGFRAFTPGFFTQLFTCNSHFYPDPGKKENPGSVALPGFSLLSKWRDSNPRPFGPEPVSVSHEKYIAVYIKNKCNKGNK